MKSFDRLLFFVAGLWAALLVLEARADDRPACMKTCAEFNEYAIRCGCGNPCMFRDAGQD